MGTWGFEILQDDVAQDIYDDYLREFNCGKNHSDILRKMVADNRDLLEDRDVETVFWLSMARVQWDCGGLIPELLATVEEIVESGRDSRRWDDPKQRSKRQKVLDAFLVKLRTPKMLPRKPRKGVKRKPVFEAGDCLCILLSDGDYGAAVVLGCPEDPPRLDGETFGKNLIGVLRYKSSQKPTREVFERREWLRLTHHKWVDHLETRQIVQVMALRFRSWKSKFEVVEKTVIRPADPKEARSITGWSFGEQMVYQAAWDAGDKREID